jgi:hypothetical protein
VIASRTMLWCLRSCDRVQLPSLQLALLLLLSSLFCNHTPSPAHRMFDIK